MKHVYTIQAADVGQGVYRHPLNSEMRRLLVAIKHKFGGIMACDVGKKIYVGRDNELAIEGSF